MFHSLTLTKQILAVCSYTLKKHSANGGKRSSGGHGGQRHYGHYPRSNTFAEEQQSSSLGWRGQDCSRLQPLPVQAWPIHTLDAVLPSWHSIHPIPIISTMSLRTNFMANTRLARSGQMPVLWPWRRAPGTGRPGCPRSELPLHPAWMEGTWVGDPKAHPTPGPARGTTRSDRHGLQTSFSSPHLLPPAGFYSSKYL